VRKRDRGRCAACKLDTYAVRRKIRAIGRGATRELRRLGFKPRKSLWELDHIVPLIDGGSHELDNLQTLCTPCHVKKTAEEARLRSARAKELAALECPAAAEVPGASQREDDEIEAASVPESAPAPGQEREYAAEPPAPRPRKRASRSLDELLEQADAANARAEALLARC
jgi:hypothetical protein